MFIGGKNLTWALLLFTVSLGRSAEPAKKLKASSQTIKAQTAKSQTGRAAYYADKMQGHRVAMAGDRYDKDALTAAHKRFPLGSMVRVTNLRNNKTVVVKINDRMSPKASIIIDLSRKAAEELNMIRAGTVRVKLELLDGKNREVARE